MFSGMPRTDAAVFGRIRDIASLRRRARKILARRRNFMSLPRGKDVPRKRTKKMKQPKLRVEGIQIGEKKAKRQKTEKFLPFSDFFAPFV